MAPKKGGLGRGLDSLFTDSGGAVATQNTLRMSEIEPDKDQPRKAFTEESLQELSQSIIEHGILQPIAVRTNPSGGYKIIAGERRWRAARLAGLIEIPAIIKDVSDAEAMEIALIENLQREDLDPVEEAIGYKNLMERCGYTQEKAAEKLSKSRSAVANSLRILALPEKVLDFLKQGKLSHGHAKVILGLENAEKQIELALEVVENDLNVRDTEIICKKMKKPLSVPKIQPMKPALPREVELSLKD
ncbi:MAG: ParB/RepB/Spo0J family partition protein, partial [Oscillospiraceae bacterium]